jgi:c-di-GMP-binding flagellar brake protein YcgR
MPEEPSQTSQIVDADMLRLNVGDTLHMQVVGTADDTQYGVRYLGALRGVSFMTTLPVVNGEAIWMKPGGSYIFRTLSGMHVYAFTAKVIKSRAKPFPYAHFAYPETVRTRQVRRAARVKLNLPTLVRRADGDQVAASLRDLSLNGVLVEANESLGSVGDSLRVEFPVALDEVNKRLSIDATLRNSTARDDGIPLRAGLEFGRLSNDDLLLLHYFIDHQFVTQGA